MTHPVVEYTSEASWAMVITVEESCIRAHVISRSRTSSPRMPKRLWQHSLRSSKYVDVFVIQGVYTKEMSKEEVLPARKLAFAQLPDDPVKRWQTVIPVIEELKVKAKKLGLWNLFLSKAHYPEHGVPLTNLEVRCLTINYNLSDFCIY